MGTAVALPTPPGVYTPQHDTGLIARALEHERLDAGSAVLDLCTGSGALAVRAALRGARVTAVDISWRALATAWCNALLAGQCITVRHGDLVSAVPGRRYDLVVSNPPYVPAPAPRTPSRGSARAWDAGPDGRVFVDRICDSTSGVLHSGGVLLLVHSALCGTAPTLDRLAATGLDAAVVDRATVPFGPVLRERRSWLHSRGMLRDRHEDQEELVVVRAVRR
ncbi:HemK2/MTQ2 family protein methyltransferase [Streptomyces sp. NPDC048410]|uniref:HemK2/MTQ2 family protein methyltransferase n=1 Tax=Streptomyces sp. NPDC048410 TaxID=3365545 RepID=UPI00371CF15A